MEIKWGYGMFRLPVVNEVYYTIKLRMNQSTWLFIKPFTESLSSFQAIEKGDYVTIVSVTNSRELHTTIRKAIAVGQRTQIREQLKMWEESPSGYKTPLKYVFPEEVSELAAQTEVEITAGPVSEADVAVSDNENSLKNKFIVCNEHNYKLVWDKLIELGLTTDGFSCPDWRDMCTGIATYHDNTFQCYHNRFGEREEISIEDFLANY